MRLLIVIISCFLSSFLLAQPSSDRASDPSPLWPGTEYNQQTPDYVSVLGYSPGQRISSHAQIRQFFDALVAAHPERIQLFPYATSWEGRELFYVVIGNTQNIAQLDTIQTKIQQVADPRKTSASEASRILNTLPGTVWLSYSVHGNEISSSDAAMFSAYHLLAAQGDSLVDNVMANSLVFIDPLQNPDGRDRFINNFRQSKGLHVDTSRFAAEHDEPWPSGRVNHYLFDLNRDWLTLTQPETQGRVKAIRQWYPLVFIDAHEMGSDSTYFFAPEAIPFNPHLAEDQRSNLSLFGRNNARWFDTYGFDYFTREVFDAFYPGYGASWPSYYGGIAMTYEQASSRGLAVRQQDGNILTFHETIRHHFVSSISTAEALTNNRQKLWQDFYDYRRSAIDEGSKETVRTLIIPAQADQGNANRLGLLLGEHGAEVWRSNSEFSACGNDYASGSLVIPMAQPAKRLLRTLMDTQVDIDPDYLVEQQRRLAKGLDHQIYDVTAWSLPLMFNTQVDRCRQAVATSDMQTFQASQLQANAIASAKLAYVIPGADSRISLAMSLAFQAGLKVKSSHLPFTHADREYPSGSLIIPVANNPENLHEQLTEMQDALQGLEIVALNDSWITSGPSFGSADTANLVAPKVALAWDTPTDIYSPGATRFIIEGEFNYPVTPIRTQTISRTQLDDFDVLILPDSSNFFGSYSRVLGESGVSAIESWVQRGGVLITLASATQWAADKDTDLLSIRLENRVRDEDALDPIDTDAKTQTGTIIEKDEQYDQIVLPESNPPLRNPGVLVKALVDPDHWLSAGVASELNVLVRGQRIFTPLAQDQGFTVARFADKDTLLQSGHLWSENLPQLAYKPFVVTQRSGRGMIIGFTEDPTVRAYLNGLHTLFMNAIFRAPAYTAKLR